MVLFFSVAPSLMSLLLLRIRSAVFCFGTQEDWREARCSGIQQLRNLVLPIPTFLLLWPSPFSKSQELNNMDQHPALPTSASDNETKKNRKLNQVFIPGTPNQPPRRVCGELFVQKGEFIGATGLYAEDSTSKKQCTAMKFRISCNVNTVVEYLRSQKHWSVTRENIMTSTSTNQSAILSIEICPLWQCTFALGTEVYRCNSSSVLSA